LNLTEKKEITEKLRENLEKSKVLILTDYKGMDVKSITQLRRELRSENVQYQVVKNTLLARASENTDVALIKDHFKGPTAIAYSFDDPVAPAKVLTNFKKDNNKLDIKIGVLNGKVLDIDAIKQLSSLPSREVLLSQFLSTMNSIPQSFVRVLAGVPRNLLNVLNAVKEQKEES